MTISAAMGHGIEVKLRHSSIPLFRFGLGRLVEFFVYLSPFRRYATLSMSHVKRPVKIFWEDIP
jgi:hypothetical protein